MAKSFDKMTKDELLQYKKEVEQKLKEKEEAELLIANQCKQIGFTSLMRQAKTDSVLAKKMVVRTHNSIIITIFATNNTYSWARTILIYLRRGVLAIIT